MRHRKHTVKLRRRPDHVRNLLANQVVSLILEGRIKTTVAKAKASRRLAEKMMTLAKKGTLAHRRLAIARLHHLRAVRKLFADLAPHYLDRQGGYTRITHLGQRIGDAADMCRLEWVEHGTPAVRTPKGGKAAQAVTKPAPAEAKEVAAPSA